MFVFNVMLEPKIDLYCVAIEPQLLGVQSGFCAGRSTVEQTMALGCILDMCRVSKRTTTIIFVDFNKAFDSIDR